METKYQENIDLISPEIIDRKWITLKTDSLSNYPDGINQIYKHDIHGIIIKEAFTPEEILKISSKIKHRKDNRKREIYGETLGTVLVANKGGDKTEYFRNANILREDLNNIFETSFETTIQTICSQISGGRIVEVPQEYNQTYTSATIRFVHPNQGGMPLHKGNQFIDDPAYNHLKQIAKMVNGLSYFIVISEPEEGGELLIYYPSQEQMTMARQDLDFDKGYKKYIKLAAGDMLLFQGGNIWHQVCDVQGQKERITIGGFMAISKCERKIYYWS
ncbi:2OG-Fe(II) oxygenase [Mastigocoleus testarum]|uniref:Uncharacterized protein n=1 Tax=Mastigocoleus testarum BC008 TaxID=371196 RepID=A0A0V8A0T8_9CYAN|nr:2OG-Fe(II) oxygenase [Mastigocoleus testarum]KST70366.1 hypothetical protein BC008_45030 [Mastigocoleus testarum BC008]